MDWHELRIVLVFFVLSTAVMGAIEYQRRRERPRPAARERVEKKEK